MWLRFAVVVVLAFARPLSAQESAEFLPPFDDNAPIESPLVEAPAEVYEMFLGGVNAALMDGSVQFFNDSVDLVDWQAMSTMAGNEAFTMPQ